MIAELLKAAQTEVDNHSIYVWGGSGQLCCNVTESWIRQKENGRMPEAAVKEWEEVMNSPYRDLARCFDCSGYVSFCLKSVGALDRRMDCDGLFARSQEIYSPIDGCLLFRTNPANPNDETHVGFYFNGNQYHAKGRAYGVVAEPYKASYWQKLAWFKALKPDPEPTPPDPPTPPEPPTEQKVIVKGKSVWVRDADSTNGKKLFVAHKGQEYDLVEIAPSGWYKIKTSYPESYITNKTRYTELK